MKKKTSRKTRVASSSHLALVASMLAAPMLSPPATLFAHPPAQQGKSAQPFWTVSIKQSAASFKWFGDVRIVGMKGPQPVYQNSKNERFTLNDRGDMLFLEKADSYLKIQDVPGEDTCRFVGRDMQNRMIMQDSKRRFFFLDQTGKLNFVEVK